MVKIHKYWMGSLRLLQSTVQLWYTEEFQTGSPHCSPANIHPDKREGTMTICSMGETEGRRHAERGIFTLGKHFQIHVLKAEPVPNSQAVDTQSPSGTAGIFLQEMT